MNLDAHLRSRLEPVPRIWDPASGRIAAVLAPIYARAGEDWLLFTVRRDDLREHAGQISFPGGAADGDADPTTCALREAQEETGLLPADVVLLGGLRPRQSSSGYRVHCIVGRVPDPVDLRPDPREVARLLAIPLRALCRLDQWQQKAPPGPDGRVLRASPHFDWAGDVVWGLTGRFAFDLATIAAAAP